MENNNAPQIAIWADYHTGHRLAWVEIIIRNVFEKTHCPVLVVMPTFVFQSQEYQVFLKAQEGHFVPLVLGREPKTLSLTPPQSPFQIWRELLQVLRELKKRGIKRLVVATGDELVKAAGVAGPFRMEAWEHRNSRGDPPIGVGLSEPALENEDSRIISLFL